MSEVVDFPKNEKGSPDAAGEPTIEERNATAQAWILYQKNSTDESWDSLARQIEGVSGSSLHLFATGKYPAKGTKILERIERYRDLVEERRSTVSAPEYVETSLTRKMNRAVRKAQLLNRICRIAGESGIGKTSFFRSYLERSPRTVYVRLNPIAAKPWQILSMLLEAAAPGSGKRHASQHVYELLVETLRATNRTIIVDEAQFANAQSFDTLRCLQEEAGVPLVISGNESVHERGPRGGEAAAFVQFESRCVESLLLRCNDIQRSDVDAIAGQMLEGTLASDAGDKLLEQARLSGGLRRLVTILQDAQTMRPSPDSPVTKAMVLKAIARKPTGGGAL